ncbi:hypothetical protein DBV14_03635 [Variovorax sp. KBW07]|nr:hypothetical protein DBV14_03635 [Variovorax sp. KBW07]
MHLGVEDLTISIRRKIVEAIPFCGCFRMLVALSHRHLTNSDCRSQQLLARIENVFAGYVHD